MPARRNHPGPHPGRSRAPLWRTVAVTAAAVAAALAGPAVATTTSPSPSPAPASSEASASPSPSAPTAPSAPSVSGAAAAAPDTRPRPGACWDYGYRAAVAASGTGPEVEPVDCTAGRTALTVEVVDLEAYADGHLLAVGAAPLQAQAARTCRDAFTDTVGGTERTRSLSLLRPVWTLPSTQAYLRGAAWIRCDVVMLGGEQRLAPLPGALDGVLDGVTIPPRRVGRCATTTPGAAGSREVPCSRAHRWRAVASLDVGGRATARPDADYPGRRAVATRARQACERVATRAQGTTRFRFSAAFPSASDWREGRRDGTCWLPD